MSQERQLMQEIIALREALVMETAKRLAYEEWASFRWEHLSEQDKADWIEAARAELARE
jgi:hypothetical protein